ncbi:MAG: pantetheine-phosphate adenylyltransferase, partial [Dermatophilaceae bacterium]
LLDAALEGLPNVRIEAFEGRLLVDVCRDAGAQAIVKGLRGDTDFAYELPMAQMNRHLSGVETLFLPGDPRFGHVSSSLVKEVVALGGDVTGLVPEAVRAALLARVQNKEGS